MVKMPRRNVPGSKYKWNIVWINVALIGTLHVLAVCGLYLRCSIKLETIIFAKCIGVLSGVGVTAGAHRLWSHKSYKAAAVCQALLAIMMTLTYQNSIYTWCRDHRLHHKYTETDADPHNAKRGFFFSHVGWLMLRKHEEVRDKGRTIDMSDLEANPVVMFQHKYYFYLVVPWAFIMPTIVPWFFWNEYLLYSFLSAIATYVVSVNITWSINSLAHLFGDKPYDRNIGAVENPITTYASFGEGFHNYHHTFPWDYKASEFGFEGRNVTTGFIELLAKLGWTYDLRTPSRTVVAKTAERNGDGTHGKDKVNKIRSFCYFALFWILI